MKRIDTATAQPNMHGTGKSGFRDGHNGYPDSEPSEIDASIMNALQEEIARTVEGTGQTLDPTSYTQLLTALRANSFMGALANVRSVVESGASALYDVAYGATAGMNGDGLFCVVGADGTNGVRAVLRGFTGVEATLADNGADIFSGVANGDDFWVLVGEDSATGESRLWTAPDGFASLTLTPGTPATDTLAPLRKVCWNGTVFCAVGIYIDASENAQIQTATNPTGTWTKRTPASSSTADFSACAARTDTGVIIIGGTGAVLQKSTNNGATWTQVHDDATHVAIGSILHVTGNEWLAIATNADGHSKLLRSTNNGDTWADVELTGEVDLGGAVPEVRAYGLCKVGSAIVSLMRPDEQTSHAQMCFSLDRGLTWLGTGRMNVQATNVWSALASDGRQVVAVNENGAAIATDAVAVAP